MEAHMIEVLSDFPDGVVAMRCAGHITRQDYEQVVIPTLEAALHQHQKLRMYCQVDSLSGMSPGAMWDDVKVGLPALTHWERVAVVNDIDWVGKATRLFAVLMPFEVRLFTHNDAEKAREWIAANDSPGS
jgi:SpoIIAA-like